MFWNHRVIKFFNSKKLSVCEVFYDDETSKVLGYSQVPLRVLLHNESVKSIKRELKYIKNSLNNPVLFEYNGNLFKDEKKMNKEIENGFSQALKYFEQLLN